MDKKTEFIKIIQENEGLIFKITTFYTNSGQDRDDLYQEIVYQLWKSYDTFNKKSKLSTWMYRVALNTAIYHLKQSKKGIPTVSIDGTLFQFSDAHDQAEEERILTLYAHIQQLNLLERGIILLYLEGKSHQEIAEIIGISSSNVGTKISRIKEKLKNQITKKQ